MFHTNNENLETTNYGGKRTTKLKHNRKARRKETRKYLGIKEYKQSSEDEKKTNKQKTSISGERKKLLETKLYSKNLIKEINTQAVHLLR